MFKSSSFSSFFKSMDQAMDEVDEAMKGLDEKIQAATDVSGKPVIEIFSDGTMLVREGESLHGITIRKVQVIRKQI